MITSNSNRWVACNFPNADHSDLVSHGPMETFEQAMERAENEKWPCVRWVDYDGYLYAEEYLHAEEYNDSEEW